MSTIDSNLDIVVESHNSKLTKDEKEVLQEMVLKIMKRFPKIELGWCPESKKPGSGFWKLSFGPMKPITDSSYHPDHPDYEFLEPTTGAYVRREN